MSICIILHVCLKVCAVVNGFNERFETGPFERCVKIQCSITARTGLPSSGEIGTRVDPSLSTMLSNRKAYLVKWYCVPRSISSAHSLRDYICGEHEDASEHIHELVICEEAGN